MFEVSIIYTPANEQDMKNFIQHCKKIGINVGQEVHGHNWGILLFYPQPRPLLVGGDYAWVEEPAYSKFYDCGSNLQLACALSALRDDSDYGQWFTYRDLERFELCHFNKWPRNLSICNSRKKPHKATADELIEHFKTE